MGGATLNDRSLQQDYFDALYNRDPDPWRFRTSAYEAEKYAQTVAALDGGRFRRAVEVGCSIGELTARLAPSCDELLGVDIAPAAIQAAQARNKHSPQVRFARMTMPGQRPAGRFDLIIMSEVLYYFAADDLEQMAAWVLEALEPDGLVVLVHWLGETPDYPQTGDQASEAFIAALTPPMSIDRRLRRELYRLDRLTRRA